MEDKTARIRVNLSISEIEVEGTETFVREYVDKLEDLLESRKKQPKVRSAPQEMAVTEQAPAPAKADMPEVFGEYLQQFPRSITDIDRVLIAAYFVQSHDPKVCFTTGNTNKLLTEQGHKVANASDCVKKSTKTKRVFAVPSSGKGKYRVSRTGIDYINKLLEALKTAT